MSLGVSMKKSVRFQCLYMCTKCHCMASITYSLAVVPVGERVVCMPGANCQAREAYEVVK